MLFMLFMQKARSTLKTPQTPIQKTAEGDVGTPQGVAGLTHRPFSLEEEKKDLTYITLFNSPLFMLFMQLARSTLDDP